MTDYHEELARVGPLAPTATALVDYAKALVPGSAFARRTPELTARSCRVAS